MAATKQEQLKATLAKAGIPAKKIDVYGSQIVVTAWSRAAADKWASLLSKFSTVRGVVQSYDHDKVNTNTVLRPSSHTVWIVGAYI